MDRIFGSPDMGILPPLPTNPARSRGRQWTIFVHIFFLPPHCGFIGRGRRCGGAAAVKSFHCDSVERSGEPGSCSLLRTTTKAKREKGGREWTARPIAVVGRPTCDIDFGGTNIVFGHCVSRASRLRTTRFPKFIEVQKR